MEVMSEVTRGQVDNENNNQSQYLNISNNIQVFIYKSENIPIRNGKISEYGLEHRKVMSTARITQECNVGTWDRNRNKNRNRNRNWG